MVSTSDRGFVEIVAEWGRNRSALFAFQLPKPDEQNRDGGNQQLLMFRRGLGEGDYSWKRALADHECCPPTTYVCAPLCNFFKLETENSQMSTGLCRPAAMCHVWQRRVERNFSSSVSYLRICFLQYSHDSVQTSSFLAPSLPWKPPSIVLCCHWDSSISCSAC